MINRRNLLQTFVAATVAAAAPIPNIASASTSKSGAKGMAWRNWSGNQSAYPSQRLAPASVAELQEVLRSNSNKIRAVGAGHSFSALVPTDHTMLSIRRISGLVSADAGKKQATISAGSILSEIGPMLEGENQALVNMPDVDQQTLAGAIATATHGTGRELGCLSAYVTGLSIVTADGELHQCDRTNNAELFEAARVGLGAMGIITDITMQNREPFNLQRNASWMTFDEAMEQAQAIAETNRNFEFYTIPFTGMVLGDRLNETQDAPTHSEEIDGNDGLMDLKMARDYLSWSNKARELVLGSYMKTISPETNIDKSYSIYASERNVRFNEMEYHLPADRGLAALKEIKDLIERDFPEVFFPIECRFVNADDCWLSPFYQRRSISIAVHRYFEEDYGPLFKAIEPIFQKYEGRPHWGKLNTFDHDQFASAYARWNDFKTVRKHYDPEGRFLNPYLERILN